MSEQNSTKRENGYYICDPVGGMNCDVVCWWDGHGFYAPGNLKPISPSEFIYISAKSINLKELSFTNVEGREW